MRWHRRSVAVVRNCVELGRIVDAEAARDMTRGIADSRRADQEADASRNREDGPPVVEASDRIDARSAQERTPQRCGRVIGREPRWHDQPYAAAALRQCQSTLDEDLVPVDVPRALIAIHTRAAKER